MGPLDQSLWDIKRCVCVCEGGGGQFGTVCKDVHVCSSTCLCVSVHVCVHVSC